MGLIADLQKSVADRIRASELVSAEPAIEVLEADKGDLDAAIARAVGARGIVISVETPTLDPGDEGRYSAKGEILIEVQESISINRGPAGTQRTWLALTENIIAELMDWSPNGYYLPFLFGGYQLLNQGTPAIVQIRFSTGCIMRSE